MLLIIHGGDCCSIGLASPGLLSHSSHYVTFSPGCAVNVIELGISLFISRLSVTAHMHLSLSLCLCQMLPGRSSCWKSYRSPVMFPVTSSSLWRRCFRASSARPSERWVPWSVNTDVIRAFGFLIPSVLTVMFSPEVQLMKPVYYPLGLFPSDLSVNLTKLTCLKLACFGLRSILDRNTCPSLSNGN